MITNNGPLAGDATIPLGFRTKTSRGNYLEIGSFNGRLVAALASQSPTKMFYCVDPFVEDGHTTHVTGVAGGGAISQVEAHFFENTDSLPNVILFKETSKEFYVRNCGSLKRFKVDTVMVDGNHRFDHVISDLYLAADLLVGAADGYIYVDDYKKDDVKQAVSIFLHKFKDSITVTDMVKDSGVVLHLNDKRL